MRNKSVFGLQPRGQSSQKTTAKAKPISTSSLHLWSAARRRTNGRIHRPHLPFSLEQTGPQPSPLTRNDFAISSGKFTQPPGAPF